ncbi:MAG: elongation factor P maturation arginine rhamnosyltransferase EarP [Fusobacteriaceae bacterium]
MRGMDIFCQVIDNFGDVGVVYRLANQLKKKYRVRVYIDSLKELALLNPGVDEKQEIQNVEGIEFLTYEYLSENWKNLTPREIVIEAFGCKIHEDYYSKAKEESKLLINLEYLSSEKWTLDFHGVESLIGAKTLKKFFYIPGLLAGSGGVLFEREKIERIKKISPEEKQIQLDKYLKSFSRKFREGKKIGTLFSYEKNFEKLLETLNSQEEETILLLMGEKTHSSIGEILENLGENNGLKENIVRYGKVYMEYYPFIPQEQYDELIQLTDFNFVRGEDSFVRAILSGVPFLWHIYFQEEGVHMDKLRGFLLALDEYFEKYSQGEYEEVLKKYKKIMCDYNERTGNNLEITSENYKDFFQNLEQLKKMTEQYSDYIVKNHDLVEKLDRFINKKMI